MAVGVMWVWLDYSEKVVPCSGGTSGLEYLLSTPDGIFSCFVRLFGFEADINWGLPGSQSGIMMESILDRLSSNSTVFRKGKVEGRQQITFCHH